jgi:predicted O-linked N-acetylglucosamine transferase (SPINDLY family)
VTQTTEPPGKAGRFRPVRAEYLSNLLLTLNYMPEVDDAMFLEWHRRIGASLESTTGTMSPECGRGGPIRRIGVVSGDLRSHPVGRLLEPLLPALGEIGVEVHAYSARSALPGDPLPGRLRRHTASWRDIERVGDEEVARQIRMDKIDALIDLSGHTSHNRLGVFARRPAPLQATWLGYGATTGLRCIDLVVGDAVSIPKHEDAMYVERTARLPWPRLPMLVTEAPSPRDPSSVDRKDDAVRFGCFNNLAKINTRVLAAWARLLHQVPGSTLLLKGRHFELDRSPNALVEAFAHLGIDSARLRFEGFASHSAYWQAFSRVDIALDPFPFTGGMSTLDALWMGVPVLTLESPRMIGRQGAMFMKALGLDDWVAKSIDDYVQLGVRHADDRAGLHRLGSELRERIMATGASDPARYARGLIDVLESHRVD